MIKKKEWRYIMNRLVSTIITWLQVADGITFKLKGKLKMKNKKFKQVQYKRLLIEIKRYLKTLPATEVFMFVL